MRAGTLRQAAAGRSEPASRRRVMVAKIARELSRLPLILRSVAIGAVCVAMIGVLVTVPRVVGEYSAKDVVQAALFGAVEASVLGAIVGAVLGLVVGVLAFLTRAVIRIAAHRGG